MGGGANAGEQTPIAPVLTATVQGTVGMTAQETAKGTRLDEDDVPLSQVFGTGLTKQSASGRVSSTPSL